MQLTPVTRSVPAGDHTALTVADRQVTFTPQQPEIIGIRFVPAMGENRSAAFNLALPAFDPAVKRDDSHALLLYRFAEGQGKVVHDGSTIAPPLDLTIPAGANVHWLPGRGLAQHGQTIIRSTAPAAKLMALAGARRVPSRPG